jgi:hypothetical protein
MEVKDQSSFNTSAYFTVQMCLWLQLRQTPLKVIDIMTKYKHKTAHSVVFVGLKGTPEGRIEACLWKLPTLKESKRVGMEFCDYKKM